MIYITIEVVFRPSEHESVSPIMFQQAVWTLKMQSLTAQVMVDDIEADEEGIADELLDSETIAQVARPGTSLKTAAPTTAD